MQVIVAPTTSFGLHNHAAATAIAGNFSPHHSTPLLYTLHAHTAIPLRFFASIHRPSFFALNRISRVRGKLKKKNKIEKPKKKRVCWHRTSAQSRASPYIYTVYPYTCYPFRDSLSSRGGFSKFSARAWHSVSPNAHTYIYIHIYARKRALRICATTTTSTTTTTKKRGKK